jgi:alpha-amylase
MKFVYFISVFVLKISTISGDSEFKNPHMFDNRSSIVHLFEWKFSDIAEECKFLGEKNFGGVQVSPVHDSSKDENFSWYMRYQPVSYEIASRSGSVEEFQKMITSCHQHKIRIYVDVVLNHMATGENQIFGYSGSSAEPSILQYPAISYGPEDFNEFCLILNKSDAFEIRNCRLDGLPDLNQAKANVQSKITEFLNKLIDFGVAGFRVDSVCFIIRQ